MVQRAKVTAYIAIVNLDLAAINTDEAIENAVNKVLAENKEMFIVNVHVNFSAGKAVILYKEIEE